MKAKQAIKKYHLLNRQWVNKGYHGTLFYHFPVTFVGFKDLKKFFGDCHKIIIDTFEGEHGNWYWNYSDMVRLRNSLLAKVNKNPKFLNALMSEWKKALRVFDQAETKINGRDLSVCSDESLFLAYKEFEDIYIKEFALSISLQDPFSMTAEEFLLPHLEKILKEKGFAGQTQKYIEILTSPTAPSFLSQEQENIFKIRLQIKNPLSPAPKEIQLIKDHAKKYGWLKNNYSVVHHLDENYFLNDVRSITKKQALLELRKIQKRKKQNTVQKTLLIKKLRPDKNTKNLIRTTEVFAYMQDERKKYSLKATGIQHKFLIQFAKRLNLNMEEAKWLYTPEIKYLLNHKNKVNKDVFLKRKHFCASITTLNNYAIVEGAEAKKLISKLFKTDLQSLKELKGTVASSGIARGKVRVIQTAEELPKMKNGEILVASMTRPEFAPAMKKALAIVTNEGGITSHAAIVSRELGIPCIIGTKIATRMFKDGDIIEVDANKGIVKIIKK